VSPFIDAPTVSIECSVGVPPRLAGPPIAVPFNASTHEREPQTKRAEQSEPIHEKFIGHRVGRVLGPAQARLDEGEPACMNMTRNPATSVQTKLNRINAVPRPPARPRRRYGEILRSGFAGSGFV